MVLLSRLMMHLPPCNGACSGPSHPGLGSCNANVQCHYLSTLPPFGLRRASPPFGWRSTSPPFGWRSTKGGEVLNKYRGGELCHGFTKLFDDAFASLQRRMSRPITSRLRQLQCKCTVPLSLHPKGPGGEVLLHPEG